MTRQEYNKLILEELQKIVEANPNLRFHQLLFCCDLLHTTISPKTGLACLDDPFYVESKDAWMHLQNSKIDKKLYN